MAGRDPIIGTGLRLDLSVAPALAGDVRYGQLQVMADELVRHDPVAARSAEECRERWRQVLTQAEALLCDFVDVRLHLLRYRAVLATEGFLAGGTLLAQWSEALRQTAPADIDAAALEIVGTTLGHLLTDDHIREWQSSDLTGNGDLPMVELLKDSGAARAVNDGLRQSPALADPAATAGTQSQHNASGVLSQVTAMQAVIADVAKWLRAYPPLAALVQQERASRWLARVRELLAASVGVGAAMPDDRSPAASVTPHHPWTASHPESSEWQRMDVVALLQSCIGWFAQNEPGHPAPYFLQRAVTLMNADFHGILQALLPDAAAQFRSLTGMVDPR